MISILSLFHIAVSFSISTPSDLFTRTIKLYKIIHMSYTYYTNTKFYISTCLFLKISAFALFHTAPSNMVCILVLYIGIYINIYTYTSQCT